MNREQLKKRAQGLGKVLPHFTLMMEHTEAEEACFMWEDASTEEWVSVDLTADGSLKSMTINRTLVKQSDIELTIAERKKRAEAFITEHYPDALKFLTLTAVEEVSIGLQFRYEQLVMDLPLDGAECLVGIDPTGNVIVFLYEGVQPVPEIPEEFISKEQLKKDVESWIDFELTISELYADLYDVEKDEVRLLYEPKETYMTYRVDALSPTFAIDSCEEEEETIYQSLPAPSTQKEVSALMIEEIIGVKPPMEVLREVDLGDEKGIVWRNPTWEKEESDSSIETYFRERNEETVKAFISKETGKLKSFLWFYERKGSLNLDREACFERALSFLQLVFPAYDKFLKYAILEADEDDDDKERFMFWMFTENGISIPSGMTMVVVNRTTGEIDHYNGPNIDVEDVQKMSSKPVISKEEAKQKFLERLDFKLEWKRDLDAEYPEPVLVYVACDAISKRPIRYVDAMTGELVMDKE